MRPAVVSASKSGAVSPMRSVIVGSPILQPPNGVAIDSYTFLPSPINPDPPLPTLGALERPSRSLTATVFARLLTRCRATRPSFASTARCGGRQVGFSEKRVFLESIVDRWRTASSASGPKPPTRSLCGRCEPAPGPGARTRRTANAVRAASRSEAVPLHGPSRRPASRAGANTPPPGSAPVPPRPRAEALRSALLRPQRALSRWTALAQDRVLGALAFGELGQGLAGDQPLEMRGLLVGCKGRLVGKDLVKEKLCGLGARAVNDKAFHPRLLPRLRGKAGQDCRHRVLLSPVGLPKCCHHQLVL